MEDYSENILTLVGENGDELNLEFVDDMEYNGNLYSLWLPADMKEDDPEYGYVILRSATDEDGEEVFETVDDEAEEDEVFNKFMVLLFDDEDEEAGEDKA